VQLPGNCTLPSTCCKDGDEKFSTAGSIARSREVQPPVSLVNQLHSPFQTGAKDRQAQTQVKHLVKLCHLKESLMDIGI